MKLFWKRSNGGSFDKGSSQSDGNVRFEDGNDEEEDGAELLAHSEFFQNIII